VLIRALEPLWGVETMRRRRRRVAADELCSGPGKLTEAIGIGLDLDAAPLTEPPFEVRGPALAAPASRVVAGPRIGITRATENPWRFCAVESPYLSRPPVQPV
jgi:DNA-3-methyladenine glycosylase